MDKFEAFIKAIVKVIFKETPFDEEKANESFQKIKKSYKANRGKNNEKSI